MREIGSKRKVKGGEARDREREGENIGEREGEREEEGGIKEGRRGERNRVYMESPHEFPVSPHKGPSAIAPCSLQADWRTELV